MHQLIIFGPPGVGKGTQSELIAEKLNLYHLSTGEVLRKAINEGTELGKVAKKIVENGELVPDDIMIGLVNEALQKNVDKKNGFILDGFPRTLEQAVALNSILEKAGYNDNVILYITADEEEILRRLLKRGRLDDVEDIILNRLKIYREATEPIINFYGTNKKVLTINGVGDINEINNIIIELLSNNKIFSNEG